MENKILDYEVIKDISILYRKKIIIYGTAAKANQILPLIEQSKLPVTAVCDGNKTKQGGIYAGHIIRDISEVLTAISGSEILVVICSAFIREIVEYCLQFDRNLTFVTKFGVEHAFCHNRNNTILSAEFRNWYNDMYEDWGKLRNAQQENVNKKEYFDALTKLRCSQPVLIYTCGKVGSASIYRTLINSNVSALHVHWFRSEYGDIPQKDWQLYEEYIKDCIDRKESIKIITILREPIGRNLSRVFQLIDRPSLKSIQNINYDLCTSIKEILTSNIKKEITSNTGMVCEDRFELLYDWERWFRVELQDVFGIDVFSQKFDKEKGYVIIRNNNVECLVLTLEKMNQCHQIIEEFVGCKSLEWHTENDARNTPYTYVYEGLKKELTLEAEILDLYYCNDSLKHFYTVEEIDRFRKKWEKS